MKKLSFQNAEKLMDGILLLTEDLHVEVSDTDADFTVSVCELPSDLLEISRLPHTARPRL